MPKKLQRSSAQARVPGALAAAAAWLVSALVLCVSLARTDCLLRHPPCLTAHGERTWLDWAYRHPEPQRLFQRIGGQLRPGEPIVIVAMAAEEETYWWRAMASYFLPDHPIAGLTNLSRPPRPTPFSAGGPARVIVSAVGRVRVLRVEA
jgi:hypothetical protein